MYAMTNKQLNLENIDKIENLVYEPLNKKYLKVQYLRIILIYLVLMILALLLYVIDDLRYINYIVLGTECILALAFIVNLLLIPKAYKYKGFAIREYDISYRSGIIFPTVTTIPFRKVQQVNVRQNPFARLFGLYAIDVVNASQLLNMTSISGLTENRANDIKSLIMERIKNEL